jgi:amidase
VGSEVARDAHVVEKLRNAGAVILGKASLSEWYNCRSFDIPDGWCARGGLAKVSFFLSLLILRNINGCAI